MKHHKLSDDEISAIIRKHSPLHKITSAQDHIRLKLIEMVAVSYNLHLPETHVLPYILRSGEELIGIVYGRYHEDKEKVFGRGAIVATDQRMMLVDKKPLFLRKDELAYDAISGVSYGKVGLAGTVSLHTRFGNVHVSTFNHRLAENFVDAVEKRIFVTNLRFVNRQAILSKDKSNKDKGEMYVNPAQT